MTRKCERKRPAGGVCPGRGYGNGKPSALGRRDWGGARRPTGSVWNDTNVVGQDSGVRALAEIGLRADVSQEPPRGYGAGQVAPPSGER